MAKFYAHAVIHDHETDEIHDRGDEVTQDVPGFDELVQGGSIKDEPYVPDEPEAESSEDDVTHVSSSDEGSGHDDIA
jgi:hypothetical protein